MFTFVKTLVSLTNALVGWLKQRSLIKAGENNAVKRGLENAFGKIKKASHARSNIKRSRLRRKYRATPRDN
tara:strand:+ start:213 stop:425 length:213 start_codon:yes stop_codon:yes gene_type:complete